MKSAHEGHTVSSRPPPTHRPAPRRRGRVLVLPPPALLLILLFVLALRLLDGGSSGGPTTVLPASTIPPQALRLTLDGRVDLSRSEFEFATVKRVIDGDTLEAIVGGQRAPPYGCSACKRRSAAKPAPPRRWSGCARSRRVARRSSCIPVPATTTAAAC